MKAIVLKNDELITVNVEYYKTGQKPTGLWVGVMSGKIEYTVEDLGDYRCVFRKHKALHLAPVEETTMDIEYGTDDTLQLGMALTTHKPPKE